MAVIIAFPRQERIAERDSLAQRASHHEAMFRATGSPGHLELALRLRKKLENR